MRRTSHKILVAVVAVDALSNCYGAKLVKGPINSEHAALSADTIRAEQRRLIEKIETLERKLAQESEERTSSQAQLSVTLSELEEAVRVLSSRMEDNEQMMNRSGRGPSGSRSAGGSATLDTVDAADELYRAGYLDVTRGNYELAAQSFGDYLTRFPQGPRVAEAHYYLGTIALTSGKKAECVEHLEKYLSMKPASGQNAAVAPGLLQACKAK